jgi:hypothetical protein
MPGSSSLICSHQCRRPGTDMRRPGLVPCDLLPAIRLVSGAPNLTTPVLLLSGKLPRIWRTSRSFQPAKGPAAG